MTAVRRDERDALNYEEVEALVGVLRRSPVLTELEVRHGDRIVRLRRATAGSMGIAVTAVPSAYRMEERPAVISSPLSNPSATDLSVTTPAGILPTPTRITAGLVGVFHLSRAANIADGDTVEKGQVLGQIEAMRLMNDVVASVGGRILSRLVQEGQPVEYGQPLFEIVPA